MPDPNSIALNFLQELRRTTGDRWAAGPEPVIDALFAAVQTGHTEVLRLLLEAGAAADARAQSGQTVLVVACMKGKPQAVQILLAGGADPNAGWASRSPLVWAARCNNVEAMRLLLAAGADATELAAIRKDPMLQVHPEVVAYLDSVLRPEKRGKPRRPPACPRGFDAEYGEESAALIRAPLDDVVAAIQKLTRAKVVHEQDATDRTLTVMARCWLVFRISGMDWTIIRPLTEAVSWSHLEHLSVRLSAVLSRRAIYYFVSGTAGVLGYRTFDSGMPVELLDSGADGQPTALARKIEAASRYPELRGRAVTRNDVLFASSERSIAPRDRFDPEKFVHRTFKCEDAYVREWGGTLRAGEKLRLRFDEDRVAIERVTFIGGNAGR
jgi:hypothetical protein